MKKRLLAMLLPAVLLLSLALPAMAAGPEVAAPSAILMEASTGRILYEKKANERLHPASVTKIMTLLLVMEALDDGRISWEDTVTASAAASAKGGSQIYLRENERMSLRDMLKSVVVASANDCAAALAEHIAGSESAFVAMMNERAAELGMQDTHFVNCTGLDDGENAAEHLTTAADIAVMSRELLKHDEIRQFTTIWTDTVRGGQFGLSNTNKLIRFYDGATGLKTGYTSGAGYCISATAERDGMELIAVVMHCASSTERFESAKALLNWGFSGYALAHPEPEAPLAPIPVKLGTKSAVQPVPAENAPILIEKAQQSRIACETEVSPSLTAPVEVGQQVGTLTVRAGDTVLAELPLVAAEAVPRLTWMQLTLRFLRQMCGG